MKDVSEWRSGEITEKNGGSRVAEVRASVVQSR